EDEEEDHHRAEAADDRLDEDIPAAPAVRARLFERVVTGDLDLDPGRQPTRCGGANRRGPTVARERRRTWRIELLEGRVPVLRDVHQVMRREVRARPGTGHRPGGARHRS